MPLPAPLKTLFADRIAATPSRLAHWKVRRWGLDDLLGRPPELELYYEAGDPHSHLCAQWLRENVERLHLPVRIRMVPAPTPEAYPEAEKQRAMALRDAQRIAPAYGLSFPEPAVLPDEPACRLAGVLLQQASADLKTWLRTEQAMSSRLFSGQAVHGPKPARSAEQAIARNAARRSDLGHYLPGMWQFNGIWFWGLDRMAFLEAELRAAGGMLDQAPLLRCDTTRFALPTLTGDSPTLEFFFSFRSPYSYLAAATLNAQFQDLPIPLRLRPVLPMVMRGLAIPRAKGFYIVRDAYREAARLGHPFGHIADPVGAGAERCLRIFPLARDPQAQLRFCHEAGKAIWSEALDVARDPGLQTVCERAGIDWDEAQTALADEQGLDYAQSNREDLLAAGAWGVPTFRVGEFVCWGNDRLPMLGEFLRRECASDPAPAPSPDESR